MTILQSLRFSADAIMRRVVISMPVCALMTMAAVSTAGRTLVDSPEKSGYPGVSSR
jgi:hypothetical protein